MAKEWTFEDPGEGIHEAEILSVKAAEGDEVEDGDIVLEVETDKAAMDVPSPFTGTIQEIRVSEGDIVEVGDVLMTYREEGEAPEEEGEAPEEEEEAPEEEAPEEEAPEEEEPAEEAGKPEDTGAAAVGELPGPEPEEAEAPEEEEEPAAEAEAEPAAREARPTPASPAARRIAREEGVDLGSLEGSGPEGRVTVEDVRAAAGEVEEEARPARREAGELPDFERWGEVERIPFRSVRRATARRMAEAWTRIPHVTHMDVADVTALEALRRRYAPKIAEEGGELSLTILVMKAVVAALKEFPRFNASLDEDAGEVVLKRHYHVGVAVDTDRGLLVPVVRDADGKSLAEVAVETSRLVERARGGEIEREEMQGGTFTITNPGPIGGTAFTPIVRWPEVAILGMARARLEPVAVGEDPGSAQVAIARRLPLCLAFDHRVNDGADAARFVRKVVETLEDPEAFVLHA